MAMYTFKAEFVVFGNSMESCRYKLMRAIRPRKHIIHMPNAKGELLEFISHDMRSIDAHRAEAESRRTRNV